MALLLTFNFSVGLLHILDSKVSLKSPFYGEFRPRTLILLETVCVFKLKMRNSCSPKKFVKIVGRYKEQSAFCYDFASELSTEILESQITQPLIQLMMFRRRNTVQTTYRKLFTFSNSIQQNIFKAA